MTTRDIDEEFGEACNALFLVLKRGRGTVGSRGEGATLSEAQVAMLESVAASGPLSISAVARRAGISQPTVSRMVSTLERQGVVRKVPAPDDERSQHVELTDDGRRLWSQKRALLRRWQREALAEFPPDRRGDVVDVLRKLTAIIEDQIRER